MPVLNDGGKKSRAHPTNWNRTLVSSRALGPVFFNAEVNSEVNSEIKQPDNNNGGEHVDENSS